MYKSKPSKNIHSDEEEEMKKLDSEILEPDNFTMANQFEQNFEKFQEYPSIPSLDYKNSNDIQFMNGHSRKSFTEFSLSNNRDQFSYQPNRNEPFRTPAFQADQNQYLMMPPPAHSFDRVNKYNELQSKEEGKTLNESIHLR